MKMPIKIFGALIAFQFFSCANENDNTTLNSELNNTDTSLNRTSHESTFNVENLKGKWKEFEYPFRQLDFKDSTVKLTEEGTEEAPRYKPYKILNACPFTVNNMKNAESSDDFLVMTEDSSCEIIKLSNDTLTLSGFSSNTMSDYKISFGKIE